MMFLGIVAGQCVHRHCAGAARQTHAGQGDTALGQHGLCGPRRPNAHRPHRRAGTGRHCAAAPGQPRCARTPLLRTGTLEVNEALLTGEAELVQKRPGDTLLSGSFVVTGACAARLDKVGTDCYAARITGEARRRKRHRSEMMRALDRLLRFISIAIIPVFVIMFAKQYFFLHTGLEYAMSSSRGRHHRHDPRGALPSW